MATERTKLSPKRVWTNREIDEMGEEFRLHRIAEIIEGVDNRCMASDGPVTPTLQEMEQDELSEIYALAKGRNP